MCAMRLGVSAAALLAVAVISPAIHAADTEPAKVTSAAIRAEGLPCSEPVAAQRDPAASRPDEPVWLVSCSDARYRVRFLGEVRPRVERLP